MIKKQKHERFITDSIVCEGNKTIPDLSKKNQVHGGYGLQAITAPNQAKNGTVTDTSPKDVLAAKKFVDENHK